MDKVSQDLFEQINNNLKNLTLFLDKLSKQEIKIDSSKIYIIDYSQHLWLNLPENREIRNQLEEYNRESINDIINDNFIEFSRKIYLQIEILLNQFILEKFSAEKAQSINYHKKSRLYDFFKEIHAAKINFKPYEHDEYKTISFIMDIRDVASHGDSNGKTLAERIEAKGKSIKINLRCLKQDITEDTIRKIFTQYVANSNPNLVKIKIDSKTGWAGITLSNLRDNVLTVKEVKDDITSALKLLRHQFGNNVDVSEPEQQFPNELKDFLDKKNYLKVNHTMNWFIKEIGDFLNKITLI